MAGMIVDELYQERILPLAENAGAALSDRFASEWAEDPTAPSARALYPLARGLFFSVEILSLSYVCIGVVVFALETWGADAHSRIDAALFAAHGQFSSRRVLFDSASPGLDEMDWAMAGSAFAMSGVTLWLYVKGLIRKAAADGPVRAVMIFIYTLFADVTAAVSLVSAVALIGRGASAELGWLQLAASQLVFFVIIGAREYLIALTNSSRFSENHLRRLFDFLAATAISAYLAFLTGGVAQGILFGLAFVALRSFWLTIYDLMLQYLYALAMGSAFAFALMNTPTHYPRRRSSTTAVQGDGFKEIVRKVRTLLRDSRRFRRVFLGAVLRRNTAERLSAVASPIIGAVTRAIRREEPFILRGPISVSIIAWCLFQGLILMPVIFYCAARWLY